MIKIEIFIIIQFFYIRNITLLKKIHLSVKYFFFCTYQNRFKNRSSLGYEHIVLINNNFIDF